jgi:nucleoid DNA-binding protein
MKKHIVDELKGAGMSGVEAEHAFNQVAEAMGRVVRRGDRVRIPGIGTLVRKTRAETRRRNPRTGEAMLIGSYDVVALRNPEKF